MARQKRTGQISALPLPHTLRAQRQRQMRKAADPGLVLQVAAFLEDNALTRGWADSVGRGVNWVERQLASDEELRHLISDLAAKRHRGAQLSDEDLVLLERLKGAPIDRALANQLLAEHEGGGSSYVGQAASRYIAEAGIPREALMGIAAELQTPRNQRTELGHAISTLAGHPALAYGAAIGAGALGTAAAMEAHDWWRAQQQTQMEG
jgi:hypothetical protein